MSLFGSTLAQIFESSRKSALRLIDEAREAFDEFDTDEAINSIVKKGNSICSALSDFGKTVKETLSDFKVVVPFDEDNEELNYRVEGYTLFIRINTKTGFREMTASIPQNGIVEKAKLHINKKAKEAVIIIPKNLAEDENLKNLKDDLTEKISNATDDTLKKINDAVEAVFESVKKANNVEADDSGLEIELDIPGVDEDEDTYDGPVPTVDDPVVEVKPKKVVKKAVKKEPEKKVKVGPKTKRTKKNTDA